ncbi:hypothetical protein [Miniphocaeibacter massiliensis]|uniref:hypothetical protein n=1 Tax=Miniphocaeibacter massiliensis TaxID=2041841 RepID=UPI000C1BE285|nr:hypothetical protein [Miniphocaeibacter massiliensis]
MKKKITMLLMVTMIAITTVGCGVQNKFLKSMKSIQEYNFAEYKMSIDDIELSKNAKNNISMNAMVTQLKDVSISGNVLTKDDTSAKMNMNINALGVEIPFEVITDKDKIYMSANYVTAITDIMYSSMSMENENGELSDSLKGKYIDLSELSEEDLENKDKIEENTKKIEQVVEEYIEKMDKSKFSKKDGTLTCKFEKEDIIKIIKKLEKYIIEVYPDYPEIEESDFDVIDIFELNIGINKSKKTSEIYMKMGVDNKEEDVQTISLKMEMKHSNSKDEFKAPSKDDIMTMEEAETLIEDSSDGAMEDLKMEDKEFTEITNELDGYIKDKTFSKEEISEIVTSMEDTYEFTEDQLKKLEAYK